jgi:hypothetical protein
MLKALECSGSKGVEGVVGGAKLFCISIAVATALGGCSNIPPLGIEGPPTIRQIVDEIECEVAEAADKYPRLRREDWAVAVDLTLQVEETAGLTPTVSFIQPFATAGTSFAFGASAALKGERKRIYEELLDLKINQIRNPRCLARTGYFDLTGNLGIVEAADLGLGSANLPLPQFHHDKAFGQTIHFELTRNVSGVGPTWTLTHFTGPGGFFGAERVDTHELIISFSPGAVVTKKGTVARPDAIVRANQLNQNMLLRSLPLQRSLTR